MHKVRRTKMLRVKSKDYENYRIYYITNPSKDPVGLARANSFDTKYPWQADRMDGKLQRAVVFLGKYVRLITTADLNFLHWLFTRGVIVYSLDDSCVQVNMDDFKDRAVYKLGLLDTLTLEHADIINKSAKAMNIKISG